MLTRLYTLPSWVRHLSFVLVLAALFLMGGCTGDDVKDMGVNTMGTIIGGLALCLLTHACHF
jgi:hypothetical protein